MKYISQEKFRSISLACLSILFIAGCQEKPPANAQGRQAQPVEVGIVEVAPQEVAIMKELPGRSTAFRVAQVRARVNGIVTERFFEEGSDVEKGQALYQIDPAPYQAALDSAHASLAQANASAAFAKQQEERMAKLLQSAAVSQQDYDSAKASYDSSVAAVAAAKAAVTSAQINLGYTQVTSPISGRIGLSQVTEGAYVQAGSATLMATVQQLDPMYVDLVQPSGEAMKLKKNLSADNAAQHVAVTILREDGEPYTEEGQLQFSDVTVDSRTGAVTLRAIVPNPDLDLLPGLFLRARFTQSVNTDAILVPQQAVTRNYRGEPTVWIVSDGIGKTALIQTEATSGDQWIVTGGLKPGDKVIVSNLQKLRPGTPVVPTPWQP